MNKNNDLNETYMDQYIKGGQSKNIPLMDTLNYHQSGGKKSVPPVPQEETN